MSLVRLLQRLLRQLGAAAHLCSPVPADAPAAGRGVHHDQGAVCERICGPVRHDDRMHWHV